MEIIQVWEIMFHIDLESREDQCNSFLIKSTYFSLVWDLQLKDGGGDIFIDIFIPLVIIHTLFLHKINILHLIFLPFF